MQIVECPSDEQLASFALGDLSEPAFDAVRRHIESCEKCELRLEPLDEVSDVVVDVLRRPATASAVTAASCASQSGSRAAGRMALSAGTVLGDYVIEGPLGAGGMGHVYKAVHRQMNRIVALKLVSPEAVSSPDAQSRFRREIEAAARLVHPNVATAYDAREHEGTHYLVLEFVPGRDLARIVKDVGPLDVRRAIDYVLQAAKALAFAHRQGIVHRDIKPANLMVDESGTVKVLDMGLARLQGAEAGTSSPAAPSDTTVLNADLTTAGTVMGTLNFMAPEQAADPHGVDVRADIYSLGCTLYYLLVGKSPHDRRASTSGTPVKHKPQTSLFEGGSAIPPRLDRIYQRMVEPDPKNRFASMNEVVEQLAPFATPPASRRWLWVAASILVLCATLYGAYRLSDRPQNTREATGEPGPPLAIAPFTAQQALDHRKTWADHLDVPSEVTNTLGMKLALIPAGEFRLHGKFPVRLTRPYYVGIHEVTVGQFRKFIDDSKHQTLAEQEGGHVHDAPDKLQYSQVKGTHWRNPGFAGGQTDDHPVVQICWNDATEFCRWLSKREGRVYRLPTQSQWEWAARAGTTTTFHFGDDPSEVVRYDWCAENAGRTTHPVGQLLPNAWGLYDVQGNAAEFCSDGGDLGFELDKLAIDPSPVTSAGFRIVRGGAFYNAGSTRQINKLGKAGDALSMWGFGFRVLCETPKDASADGAKRGGGP